MALGPTFCRDRACKSTGQRHDLELSNLLLCCMMAVGRMAALGRNARALWAHYGSELVFAGSVMLGTQQILELHRFRNSTDMDVCFSKLGSLNTNPSGFQPASTLRLLVPLPFSPWQ